MLIYRGFLEIKQPLLFGISARRCNHGYQLSVAGRGNHLTLQSGVRALHLVPNFEAILRRLHTVENSHCEWSLLQERNYDIGQLLLVLLEVDLVSKLAEFLETREVNHPMLVMEGAKGSMTVLAVSVATVGVNVVGAGGSVEMIGHAKPMRREQQAARSLL